MGYWKMGVGLPIANNSFGWGTRVYAKLDPPLSQVVGITGYYLQPGTTTWAYKESTGDDIGLSDGLVKYVRSGDRLRFGPSSWPGYEGNFEDMRITGVDQYNLSGDPLVSAFGLDDPIAGVGTNCPGGWNPFEQGTLLMGGITDHNVVKLITSPGYINRHSVQFQGSGSGTNGIQWNFNTDDYVSAYYRMGYWYQMPSTSGFLGVDFVANGGIYSTANTSTEATEWTEYNGSVGSKTPTTTNSTFYTRIFSSGTSGGGSVLPNIDHFYVEHAAQTSDEALGVYTFDDYPALGSRQFKTIDTTKSFRLANKRLVRNSVGNDTYKRYMVSASFQNVSTTLRDNLEVFVDWQDLGKPLVLHHDIPSVPPNLYGIMTIKDTAMGHWSGGVCSFSIDFEEM